MSSDLAINITDVSKCFHIYEHPRDRLKQFVLPRIQRLLNMERKNYFREFWALRQISFKVEKGETVGIIGRNGSGKSTLLQLICGTLNHTSGKIEANGRIAALLELGSGFNPEFTGRENVYLNAEILGLSREETDLKLSEIFAFADIDDFIDQPVKTYSSGMVVRLAFAVAINVDPEILIIDEALAVGDAAFQRKCLRKIEELSASGVTLLFVSHDIETVKKICTQAVYLSNGQLRHIGSAKEICIEYERDLFGASQTSTTFTIGDNTHEKPDEFIGLDPELLISAEQVYGDGRATISNIKLTSRHKKANLFKPGSAIEVHYKVAFKEPISKPIFGMMITNKEGIAIFGTNTTGQQVSSSSYLSGDEILITFSLVNNLAPGIYYLTCGVHSDDDENGIIYLCRRMDVLIFKSLEQEKQITGGFAQLYPEIETSFSRRAT